MITIYSTPTCPRCKVLKTKLAQKGIPYEECMDESVMQSLGILSVPVLSVDDKLLDFSEAVKYVNER